MELRVFYGPHEPVDDRIFLAGGCVSHLVRGGRIATGRRDYSCDENQAAFFQATQATLRLHCTPSYV